MTQHFVLLVEDQVLLADALEADLALAGFIVTMAYDGIEALENLEFAPARYDAIVTDIRLGKGSPNGWDVARRARELIPHVPVVYITGDSTREWILEGVPHSIMIAKPFEAAQVILAISTLIDNAAVDWAA